MRRIDAYLNRVTMYRSMLYSLMGLLVTAELFALAGFISISAGGLVLSVMVLCAVAYGANWLLSRFLRIPSNYESWLITALILACILPPINSTERALGVAAAALIAIVSKYVIVYRGAHVFNPAAFGALAVSVIGLSPVTWWIATPALVPFSIVGGFFLLRKVRRFTLFAVFAASSFSLLLFLGLVFQDQQFQYIVRSAILSWPIVFFGTIMLTEPATSPRSRYYQALYAVLIGALFASQLQSSVISTSPQLALLMGNIFILLAVPARGALVRFTKRRQLAPNIYEFSFAMPMQPIRFLPGQYTEWTLPHVSNDARGNRRTFSLVSAPDDRELKIAIKTYKPGSSFKTALLALQPGQLMRVAHPGGSFVLPRDATQPLVFIAGGIGITPFISMLQLLIATGERRPITLFYLARDKQDFAYKDILSRAAKIGVVVYLVTGQLESPAISKAVTLSEKFYISGPDTLVTNYKKLLQSLGVPRGNIKTDHFSGY